MAKIYIARSPVGPGEHSYFVYDPDGNPRSGDERVIRGGPPSATSDIYIIEADRPIQNSKDALNGADPYQDRYYTTVVEGSSTSVQQTWNDMVDRARNLGTPTTDPTFPGETGYRLPSDYNLFNINCNILTNTIGKVGNIDVPNNLPKIGGDPGTSGRVPKIQYLGIDSEFVSAGNDVVSVKPGSKVIYDQGGSDTYIYDPNDFTTQDGPVYIYDDNGSNTADRITITGLDPQNIRFERDGNDLRVFLPGDVIPSIIIKDQFKDGVPKIHEMLVAPPIGGVPQTLDLRDPNDFPVTIPAPIPGWVPTTLAPLNDAPGIAPPLGGPKGDPLVLDLDGDGQIALTDVAGGVYYDLRKDGFKEKTAWVGAGDGMLVFDANGNGTIDGYNELLASPNTLDYVTYSPEGVDAHGGFAAMGSFDTNNDGVLNAQDTGYTQLKIWQDVNQNGQTDTGELKTLSQWNIASIDIAGAVRDPWLGTNNFGGTTINGNLISHTSTFTLTNGQTRTIVDAWLSNDLLNSQYTGTYTLNPKVLFLPTLKGFGHIPDLHVAMSQNATLLTAMETFATKRTFTQLFSDFQTVKSEVRDMLFEWAGVSKTPVPTLEDKGFSGVFSQMPEYYFFKKFMGVDTVHAGMWFDQTPFAPDTAPGVEAIYDSFDRLLTQLTSQLIYQVGANTAFAPGGGFDPWSATFSGTFALSQSSITQLQTVAATQSDKPGFWNNFVKFLDVTKGLSNVSASEITMVDNAIKQSTSNAMNWSKILLTLNDQQITTNVYKATMNGTQWDDVMIAYSNYAETRQAKLYGGYGNDKLYGAYGDDLLQGGVGNDYLEGGFGNDTYFYESGHDVVAEHYAGGGDKIEFATGIKLSDLTVNVFSGLSSSAHVYIEVKGRGSITIANSNPYVSLSEQINQLKFSDGTTIKFSDMAVNILGKDDRADNDLNGWTWTGPIRIYGFAGDDTLRGADTNLKTEILYGGAGNDILMGNDTQLGVPGGNDILYGEAGNDILMGDTGNDILVGGAGNDRLEDYSGNDVYEFSTGFGIDRIVDYTGVDTIAFKQGITVDSLSIVHANDMMRIVATPGVDEVQFDLASYATSVPDIETITFLDGFSANFLNFRTWVWGATTAQTTNGTTGVDTILGRGGNDTINGNNGDDALHGGSGNDIVRGGNNNDQVHGGIGADTLYGDAGNDLIYGDDGLDKLYGGTGSDTFMFLKESAFKNIDTVFDFKVTESDKINIKDLLQGYDPLTKVITDFVQITTSGANSILRVDADGGANGFVQIATLNAITGLTDEQALVTSGHLIVT